MTIDKVNPNAIKADLKASKVSSTKDFGAFLGAVNAMSPAGASAAGMYGDVKAQSVLNAAFSGMQEMSVPSYASGKSGDLEGMMGAGSYNGMKYNPALAGIQGGTAAAGEAYPGSGVNTAELMNTMYQNNLKLLELQALMQSSMQKWNTKSNILSADHRARMAMIEKFTVR